jgi:hypothetical protein
MISSLNNSNQQIIDEYAQTDIVWVEDENLWRNQ